jgi:hypothetical protein
MEFKNIEINPNPRNFDFKNFAIDNETKNGGLLGTHSVANIQLGRNVIKQELLKTGSGSGTAVLGVDGSKVGKGILALKKFLSFGRANSKEDIKTGLGITRRALSNNIVELKELLSSEDMVMSMILAGYDSVDELLFPALIEYLHRAEPTNKEKQTVLNHMKAALKEAERIHKQDFDAYKKKVGGEGLDRFKQGMKIIVKSPLKFF